MEILADLHIHSKFSRATSGQCTLEGLHRWAQLKGVRVVGTGDFTHPVWFAELREKLVPSAPGLYRLSPALAGAIDAQIPPSCRAPVDFILSGEISSIYKRAGRCRKVHSLVLVPDLAAAEKINRRLAALGNIASDGRPILGLDPRILLTILLEAHPAACLIPAHIWTPWFSMLGSNSGFDSPEECFGELRPHIFAAETGLSSDPPMNWRVSSLDSLCLVSNSDLHSPQNLGRNANRFFCEPDYFALMDGLRRKDPAVCGGTLDLFPEEGKYHADGHRKCNVCLEPEESLALKNLCPVCNKPLVLGVLHRVVELADRPRGGRPATALPCEYILPLQELLADVYDCGAGSKKVVLTYHRLLQKYGAEFRILRELPPEQLEGEDPALLAEALRRLRAGKVHRSPGYDGEYGVIRVFEEGERDQLSRPNALFSLAKPERKKPGRRASERDPEETGEDAKPAPKPRRRSSAAVRETPAEETTAALTGLTEEQQRAALACATPVMIVAGPGAGKTRTLTHRIAHQVLDLGADPASILAATFTNRAAGEMRERLTRLLGEDTARRVNVCTFHAFCLQCLRRFHEAARLPPDFLLMDRDAATAWLQRIAQTGARDAAKILDAVETACRNLEDPASVPAFAPYAHRLKAEGWMLLDEIVPACVRLFREHPELVPALNLRWICVDEYQDVDRAQYELVRLLAPQGVGLCVIGDPDQAIYGFRGSDVSFFLRFTEDYPDAVIFRLGTNFRSGGAIVEAAGQVMAPGKTRLSVETRGYREEAGLLVRFHEAPTAAAEAEFITHEVEQWLGGTALFSIDSARVGRDSVADVTLGDIAVLVRLRALMPPIAQALERLGLPVQVVGEQPAMEEAGLRRMVKALQALGRAPLNEPAAAGIALVAESLAKGAATAEEAAGLQEALRRGREFTGSLREFLDFLLLAQGPDRYDPRAERITVMTLHAAKGLEFPVVFIAACEDGILPYARGGKTLDLEEERRLLYVGMTRAQRALYLTSARKRALFGDREETRPSPFIREIEARLQQRIKPRAIKSKPASPQEEFPF